MNTYTFSKYINGFQLANMNDAQLFSFKDDDKKTQTDEIQIADQNVALYINEFWTAKQRQASALHEISYRACFKPQLPEFFIKQLSKPKDIIYDPFSGRGTTVIQAGLMDRKIISNDINPLSRILAEPRFKIPLMQEIKNRLDSIPFNQSEKAKIDLSMFYDSRTESEIVSLKNYLIQRKKTGKEDYIDKWIRMVATNRLTGHSKNFFSIYTLPPNQAITPERQTKINKILKQQPKYKNVKQIILIKSGQIISKIFPQVKKQLFDISQSAIFLENDARSTYAIPNSAIQLTVTSPPFLDIVQYAKDNWLRCWFNDIDAEKVEKNITMSRKVEDWSKVMSDVFMELFRVTKKNGWVVFEVGEVKNGKINLDEYVVPLGKKAGFSCLGIIINKQNFTKTSNIWGVKNNTRGTNSNRIVVFNKKYE